MQIQLQQMQRQLEQLQQQEIKLRLLRERLQDINRPAHFCQETEENIKKHLENSLQELEYQHRVLCQMIQTLCAVIYYGEQAEQIITDAYDGNQYRYKKPEIRQNTLPENFRTPFKWPVVF